MSLYLISLYTTLAKNRKDKHEHFILSKVYIDEGAQLLDFTHRTGGQTL